jgi:hypothetical protein
MTEMRTWDKPAEPEGPIEGVRDVDGDLWRPARDSGWFNCGQRGNEWTLSLERVGSRWTQVLECGPLREVTENGERIGPIEITQAMTDAADGVLIAAGCNITGGRIAATLAAALRAEGYVVTGVAE